MKFFKNSFLQTLVTFFVAFAIGLLIVSHLKHTVLNTFIGSSGQASSSSLGFYDAPGTVLAYEQINSDTTDGCGCPSCCAVQAL